jgi:hypothetical protein
MFIAALVTIAKLWKQPRCPTTDDQVGQENVILVDNGILLSHEEK